MWKVLILVLLFPFIALGADEILEFDSEQQAERYRTLIHELRCPKCLNQSIADSDAGISEDLRNIVYEKIKAGQSNKEIKDFLKQRYGDFILYNPEASGANLILWFGPGLCLLIALIWLVMRIKGNEKSVESSLSDEESDKLERLLSPENKSE
ncbi:MAG: cytochrome c-type biogenesis protein CcmH [Gammaproteobacteria bacterium]|nr:cytochrome c-type biogenesis protein CcmH [Gammaproteobacteria bacterium]